jgi:hypothetical protein
VNAADIRRDVRRTLVKDQRMDNIGDEEIFAEAIVDGAFNALSQIGNDPDARYAFFKRFLELAREVVEGRGVSGGGFSIPRHCNQR